MNIKHRIELEMTYGIGERMRRWREKIAMFAAWHLIPSEVRKWVIVRAHAARTQGQYSNVHPDTVSAFDLYKTV